MVERNHPAVPSNRSQGAVEGLVPTSRMGVNLSRKVQIRRPGILRMMRIEKRHPGWTRP